ncbi:MAG: Panacea domain-containing protein [Methanimicrococcus sp.]|nr:Panacea domain-containing protein [Methanimicrococcus sp.]
MTPQSVENPKSAVSISQWFIQNNLDSPANTNEGNTKLQKLLFFAWLIHYHEHETPLFDDDFYAFPNGPVVETVRQEYKFRYQSLKEQTLPEYTNDELATFTLVKDIFGDSDAEELIEISHNSPAWSKYNTESIQERLGCNDSQRPKIPRSAPKTDLKKELKMIRNVLFVHRNPNMD